jgi:hypothetical protein
METEPQEPAGDQLGDNGGQADGELEPEGVVGDLLDEGDDAEG